MKYTKIRIIDRIKELEQAMIIDTHAHYDDEAFNQDRDEVLHQLKTNGIENVINVGASMQTTRSTMKLIDQYDFMYGAVGVHPNETAELTEDSITELKEYAAHKKVVAIGEIGLDYYWDTPDRETQIKWFKAQLSLAKELNLPIIIHSRDAAKDTMDILSSEEYRDLSGVIHCYSYSLEMAKQYVAMGYYLGIGGVVTFHNAKKLKEVVENISLNHLVLETDCPYLAPVPNRGKRNSSMNLPYVIKEIARLKNIDEQEVIAITTKNARDLYHLLEDK